MPNISCIKRVLPDMDIGDTVRLLVLAMVRGSVSGDVREGYLPAGERASLIGGDGLEYSGTAGRGE